LRWDKKKLAGPNVNTRHIQISNGLQLSCLYSLKIGHFLSSFCPVFGSSPVSGHGPHLKTEPQNVWFLYVLGIQMFTEYSTFEIKCPKEGHFLDMTQINWSNDKCYDPKKDCKCEYRGNLDTGHLNTGAIWIQEKLKSHIQMVWYLDEWFLAVKWSFWYSNQMVWPFLAATLF
jgi:hypothetical protein